MSFLMCPALSCVLRTVISHSILLSYLLFFLSTILSDHSIGLLTLDHSIGLFLRNHSIGFRNIVFQYESLMNSILQRRLDQRNRIFIFVVVDFILALYSACASAWACIPVHYSILSGSISTRIYFCR